MSSLLASNAFSMFPMFGMADETAMRPLSISNPHFSSSPSTVSTCVPGSSLMRFPPRFLIA